MAAGVVGRLVMLGKKNKLNLMGTQFLPIRDVICEHGKGRLERSLSARQV